MNSYNTSSTDDIHFLTKEDVYRLFEATDRLNGRAMTNEMVRLMLELTYETACRISEIVGLLAKDVDVKRRRIVLTSTKGGRQRCSKCKGKKIFKEMECGKCMGVGKIMKAVDAWCTAPTFDRLTKVTLEYKPEQRVFPISRQSAWNIMQKLGQLAGVEAYHNRGGDKPSVGLYCHILRHSYAVHAVQAGMEISILACKLRHASTNTTSIYLKCSPQDVIRKEEELAEKLKELEELKAEKLRIQLLGGAVCVPVVTAVERDVL